MTSPGQLLSFPPPRVSARIAAAVLLLMLLTGSMFVALYPHWTRQASRLPIIAPQAVATATSGDATVPLLELTIPELTNNEAFVEVFRFSLPPAVRIEEDNIAGNAPQVLFVEDGTVRLLSKPGAQPMRILRGGAEANQEILPAGQATDVAAGDGFVIEMGGAAELSGAGPETAVLLDFFGPTNLGTTGIDSAVSFETLGGVARDLTAPLDLVASRVTLAPDASLSGPESPDVVQIVAGADTERAMDLRTGRDGSARNAGDEPLDVYVLSLTSSPVAPATVDQTTLVDVTLTEPSAYRAMVLIDSTMFPPGSSSRESTGDAPKVIYVVEGEMTARLIEGSRQAFAIPPAFAGAIDQGEPVAAGESAGLTAGAMFVAPPNSIIEVSNAGTTALRIYALLSHTTGTERTRGGVNYEPEASSGGALRVLSPSQQLVFSKVTLGPGATLVAPDRGTFQEYVAVDGNQMTDLRRDSSGALRNAGDEPLDAYVLTVNPARRLHSGHAGDDPARPDARRDPAYLALTETPAFEAWAGTATTHFPPGSSVPDVPGTRQKLSSWPPEP